MIKLEVTYKERIDKYISNNTEISRNDIKSLIEQRAVFVNGTNVIKPKYIVREGQIIEIVKLLDKETDVKPKEMEINVIYEDDDLLVIDKPSDLVVHPAPGHTNDTLVNGLLYHFKNNLSNENGLLRPGIVHRIDKDTSGLLMIAKNNEIHKILTDEFKQHNIKRSYVAICEGVLNSNKIKLNLPIGRDPKNRQQMTVTSVNSKEAITHIELLKTFYYENKPLSLVKCELETGRTHQIRVHLAYIKNPVYGDPVYGNAVDDFNQRLHAYKLEFIHPITQKHIILYSNPPIQFNISEYNFEQLKENNKL